MPPRTPRADGESEGMRSMGGPGGGVGQAKGPSGVGKVPEQDQGTQDLRADKHCGGAGAGTARTVGWNHRRHLFPQGNQAGRAHRETRAGPGKPGSVPREQG